MYERLSTIEFTANWMSFWNLLFSATENIKSTVVGIFRKFLIILARKRNTSTRRSTVNTLMKANGTRMRMTKSIQKTVLSEAWSLNKQLTIIVLIVFDVFDVEFFSLMSLIFYCLVLNRLKKLRKKIKGNIYRSWLNQWECLDLKVKQKRNVISKAD